MKKQSDEAFKEEVQVEYESYLENEDAHGRLPVNKIEEVNRHDEGRAPRAT